uniref:Uncharacterized protein n=1 Tax=Panagrolaimus sp. ES5 TaxID=591445 RepID=A0AC34GDT9_9BILA
SEQAEEGFDSLSILYEEPLTRKHLTSNYTSFDWEKAKTQFVKSCKPKMRMLTFGITRALARFAKDPTIFQALSVRSTDKPLCSEFEKDGRRQNFKTSEMAFKQCLSPYSDAGIKLAFANFYSKDYHKCLPLLGEMFTARSNCLALWVIKSEITKINKFWKFYVGYYFPSNSLFFQEPTISFNVYEKIFQETHNFAILRTTSLLFSDKVEAACSAVSYQ